MSVSRPRTFQHVVLRVLVPRLVLFAVGCLVLAWGHALSIGASAGSSTGAATPVPLTLPTWSATDAARHPECMSQADWPAGRAAAYVVGQAVRDGSRVKVTFDRAWRLNHDQSDVDDLWVLGLC